MPATVVPEEVLQAVVAMPEMWPAILEWALWFKDAKTGRVEIIFGNGVVKDMLRHEHLAQGKSVELPEGMIPICPDCGALVEWRDYNNKVYCARCDRTRTIWEIKRGLHYRPAKGAHVNGTRTAAHAGAR